MKNSSRLKRKFTFALFALLIAFAAIGTSSFAWYIYNTSAHTTKLHMAAGSASSLLISDKYDGEYKYALSLDSVVGELFPVSTNSITGGFQEAEAVRPGEKGEPEFIAYLFGKARPVNYFVKSLYLRSSGKDMDVYVRNIGFKDSNTQNPISTAIRVGLVVYKPGQPDTVDNEYIFEINPDQHIQSPVYNTSTGKEGYVLDAYASDESGKKKYGVTVKFDPLSPENYLEVNSSTYEASLKAGSQKIAVCPGSEDAMGSPVKVDVYIWLEGCDSDCVGTLGTLTDLSVEFTGFING